MSSMMIDIIFNSGSQNPSWIPSIGKEMINGQSHTISLMEGIKIAKSNKQFTLDLDSIGQGGEK